MKAANYFNDSAHHIFTEGTQFDKWGSGSERKANSWVGPQNKKARCVEWSTSNLSGGSSFKNKSLLIFFVGISILL